jgi:hypothetical protein
LIVEGKIMSAHDLRIDGKVEGTIEVAITSRFRSPSTCTVIWCREAIDPPSIGSTTRNHLQSPRNHTRRSPKVINR